jgi:dienelactone hydrolase
MDHRIVCCDLSRQCVANHAFNNDTSQARYNKHAADLAWGRTIAFFKQKLG